MKMGDGSFRPAYNGQFATATDSQVVVGVAAFTVGTDMGQRAPRVEQVAQRGGRRPAEWLVDGIYPAHEQLDRVAAHTVIYAPVPKPQDAPTEPHFAKGGDSAAVGAWRERMRTEEAKAIHEERAATAECVNAQARERGLTRRRVRGAAPPRSAVSCFVCPRASPDAHPGLGTPRIGRRGRCAQRNRSNSIKY